MNTDPKAPPPVAFGGRRSGKTAAMAQAVKSELAKGRKVLLATGGSLVPVVGVVDDPNTRLIEQSAPAPNHSADDQTS